MFVEPKLFFATFLSLLAVGALVGTVSAQNPGVAPHVPDNLALAEDEVKQLLPLMDTDKNGKVSRQDYMKFMEAEFNRLDTYKNGELDPRELAQSRVRVRPFASVGK